jgi:hypothetical protein
VIGRRAIKGFFWTLAALPIAGLGGLYSFVLHARLVLGRWPRPYQPDPKDLGLDRHYAAVGLLLEAALLASVPVLLAVFVREHAQLSTRRWLGGLTLYVLGVALMVGAIWLDPGHFIEWYFD